MLNWACRAPSCPCAVACQGKPLACANQLALPRQVLVWLTWAFIAALLALLVLTYNLFPGEPRWLLPLANACAGCCLLLFLCRLLTAWHQAARRTRAWARHCADAC